MSDPAPIVDYEESPLRDRVMIEKRDGTLRVTTPPLLKFSKLGRGYRIGIIWVLAIIVLLSLSGLPSFLRSGDATSLIGVGEGMVLLLILFAWGWNRLRTHYCFEVSVIGFAFRRMSAGHVTSAWTIRRDRIGHIHASEGRKIVVPLGDGDFLNAEISDSKEDVARVADALAEAVAANPERIDRSLPERVDNIDALRTPGMRRNTLYIYMLSAAAVGLLLTGLFRPVIGVCTFFALLMPMGVILGTQKKDYWQ